MTFWVIYENPTDFPGEFVIRRRFHLIDGRQRAEATPFYRAATLEEARGALPPCLANVGRDPQDDVAIREMWI